MKIYIFLIFFYSAALVAQQPYYDDVNIQLTGQALYEELSVKLETYNVEYNYSDYRDGMPITDSNPQNSNEVLLLYGYNDTDGNCTTDRTRSNGAFGGDNCQYNREHTFARSLANPGMGNASSTTTGIAADPHNLRPSDVQRNGLRGSKKFADGSGDSGNVSSGHWYPGDEWRGDVARAMMYMYVRYGERCLPSLVAVGDLEGNTQMLELFLQWNVDDPVSDFEEQRNDPLEIDYGSRNPFIDNPYLATLIWGGPMAENKWEALSIPEYSKELPIVYPNPVSGIFTIARLDTPKDIILYNLLGQIVYKKILDPVLTEAAIDISSLPSGLYILQYADSSIRIIKQ